MSDISFGTKRARSLKQTPLSLRINASVRLGHQFGTLHSDFKAQARAEVLSLRGLPYTHEMSRLKSGLWAVWPRVTGSTKQAEFPTKVIAFW